MDFGGLLALFGGLAGGLLLSNLMGQKGQQPQAPMATPPPAPPGIANDPMAQTPDYSKLLAANTKAARSGPSAGAASTFKSGPGGVDPNSLALGTNTLLGA